MLETSTHSTLPDLSGIHALVSGGTTGIGRAIMLLLARQGAKVFIYGRHEKELADALEAAKGLPGTVTGMVADQSSAPEVEKVFQAVDAAFPHLDVLVNNAAVGGGNLLDESDETITYTVLTNVCGYLYCTRRAIERMKRRKAGHIINIGSISAENRKAGGEIYTATKAANQAFSESIRKSIQGDGIKVTLVEPGKTGSDIQEMSREELEQRQAKLEMMKAEDIAEAVCFCLTLSRRAVITSLQIEPSRLQ